MTKMATDPLLFLVAIFAFVAIFEVGHIHEHALIFPDKYEDGHEIAVREREREESPVNKAKMANCHEDGHQRNRGLLGKFAVGIFAWPVIGTPPPGASKETPTGTVAGYWRLSFFVQDRKSRWSMTLRLAI